jgi:EAL domain-containing protein (putative c-di-GMP-specific phosphodiesterase class I)
LEITETALMDSPGEAAELLRNLRKYGIKVYLDVFGTGYSSLSHLHTLPVDALKIDRSFVDGLGSDPDDSAIVEAVIRMAQTLDLDVVAEGVETQEQLAQLERLSCRLAQGYLFSRPLPASELWRLLSDGLSPAPPDRPRP